MEEFLVKHFPQYAPFVLVVLIFFLQYKFFVTPADLEKRHRLIKDEFDKRFVTWTVFNATVSGFKEQLNKVETGIEKTLQYIIDMRGE